ncbi:NACHT domain protein [Apiospora marii]|uniref:NACHT domain protein n=1 Tax=Apiospora marii TaxID=335849 RepID=UPI00312FD003
MAKSMKLSSISLEVLKLCMHHFQAINHTQTSTYEEVEQSVQLTFQEALQSASSFKTVTSEKTLEKAIFDYAGSITTMSSTTFASVNSLVTHYISQRRWQDASHLLERALRGIWPSLFSTNVYDITLVREHVEECVDLVRRLAECYSIRQRKTEEEDIRVRLYRAMRSGRKVDDKLWEQVTQELLSFYTKTRQNEAGITVRQERLDGLTAHHGEQHNKYYQKIIRVLNGDGFISKPEVPKPILLVATELWTKGAFSEAMLYYKTFFSTFFAVPKSSPTFQDQTLMRKCFDRYLEYLRHTKMAFSVVHKVSSEYQSHGLF